MAVSSPLQLSIVIHPVVIFTICDSYERRNEDIDKIHGTLLGKVEKERIEIRNCFIDDNPTASGKKKFNLEEFQRLFDLHQRVYPSEVIVGRFSTGNQIDELALAMQAFFSRVIESSYVAFPIHLLVDTNLTNSHMGIQASVYHRYGVPGNDNGSIFTPIHYSMSYYPEEMSATQLFQRNLAIGGIAPVQNDMQQVIATSTKIDELLDEVIKYVEDVMAGNIPFDSKLGRSLSDAIISVPQIDQSVFKDMMNNSTQDLLMVTYLGSLIRTQLALAEKLNTIL